jgi:hypothetical protein
MKASDAYDDNSDLPTECGASLPYPKSIDITFNGDFTMNQSEPLHVGRYARITYKIERLGRPCSEIELCMFYNHGEPTCKKISYRPFQIQHTFIIKSSGKLNIYVHSYSPNPYHVPGTCDKYDSNYGSNWQFDVLP